MAECSVEIFPLKPQSGPTGWEIGLHYGHGGARYIEKACAVSFVRRLVFVGAVQSLPLRLQQRHRRPLSLNQMVGSLNVGGVQVRE